MDTTFMSNYMDILNESLGDDCVYYITDNTPIFNIDSLVESYQCDIRDILMEASGGDKRKNFITKIRKIGEKVLAFLSSILEKVKNFFKKFREYIARKIEAIRRLKNNKGGADKNGEGILDKQSYEQERREKRNKKDADDDDVNEEDLPIVNHKDDIAEEKRQEELKKEEQRKKQEAKKKEYEAKKKEYEECGNAPVYKEVNYMKGVAEVNKFLDVCQDGFKDYIADMQEFSDVQNVLRTLGVEFKDNKVNRLNNMKEEDRIKGFDKKFTPMLYKKEPAIYTNGKFNTKEEIDDEINRIKRTIYGNGDKIKLMDFKGTLEKDVDKYLEEINNRVSKIGNNSNNICSSARENIRKILKQVEYLADDIYYAGEGTENLELSKAVDAFVGLLPQLVKNLTRALNEQVSTMKVLVNIISDAAVASVTIKGRLLILGNMKDLLDSLKDKLGNVTESINDYDGMGWIREILLD